MSQPEVLSLWRPLCAFVAASWLWCHLCLPTVSVFHFRLWNLISFNKFLLRKHWYHSGFWSGAGATEMDGAPSSTQETICH